MGRAEFWGYRERLLPSSDLGPIRGRFKALRSKLRIGSGRPRTNYRWVNCEFLKEANLVFLDANLRDKQFLMEVTDALVQQFPYLENSPFSETLNSRYRYFPSGSPSILDLGPRGKGQKEAEIEISIVKWDINSNIELPSRMLLVTNNPNHNFNYQHSFSLKNGKTK